MTIQAMGDACHEPRHVDTDVVGGEPPVGRNKGRSWWQVALIVATGAALIFFTGHAPAPPAHSAPVPGLTRYVPQTRVYYIAADKVVWDYAPSGRNEISGASFDGPALTFTQNGPDRIGRR